MHGQEALVIIHIHYMVIKIKNAHEKPFFNFIVSMCFLY